MQCWKVQKIKVTNMCIQRIRGHTAVSDFKINKMTDLILPQNVNGNQEPIPRKWRKHCQIGRAHYNTRKPTHTLRVELVEKISISLSIVNDSLPERTIKKHLLIYAVGLFKIKARGGRKYDVYTESSSPNPNVYSVLTAICNSLTPLSRASASVSCRHWFLCIQCDWMIAHIRLINWAH